MRAFHRPLAIVLIATLLSIVPTSALASAPSPPAAHSATATAVVKFAFHAGLAFGAFRYLIYKPYRAGTSHTAASCTSSPRTSRRAPRRCSATTRSSSRWPTRSRASCSLRGSSARSTRSSRCSPRSSRRSSARSRECRRHAGKERERDGGERRAQRGYGGGVGHREGPVGSAAARRRRHVASGERNSPRAASVVGGEGPFTTPGGM